MGYDNIGTVEITGLTIKFGCDSCKSDIRGLELHAGEFAIMPSYDKDGRYSSNVIYLCPVCGKSMYVPIKELR